MDVKLGTGLATGMFYHAPAGTALPTYPAETLASGWVEVGDVSDAGITLATNKSSETIQAPIMDTTEESLKTVVGSDNVTTTAAVTGTHGKLINVNLSDGDLPEPEAFLWLMKDGDAMIATGCERGQVTATDNVSFAPGGAINWVPTITALDEGFQLIMDEGE